jgi:3-oxoacyl-(acyl-carrier-protein) synthase/acyl carrier protein
MIRPIAVIGMSVEVPDAQDIYALWEAVRDGRNLTRPFPAQRRRDAEEYFRHLTATAVSEMPESEVIFHDGSYLDRIDGIDARFFGMTPKQASTTDPHLRLFLRNMYRAIEDAGYAGRIRGTRTGVYVGFAANPGNSYFEYFTRIDPSLGQVGLVGNVPTMMANRLSRFLDLHGPSIVVDSACSASLVAVHQAKNALLMGDCDMAVVAGARVARAPVNHTYTRIGIESSDGMTRTLDVRADGAGTGEGAGAIVLKLLDRAISDGDQVYAVIRGSAVNHDGGRGGITSPDPNAQAELLLAAWQNADVDPATLGYIELHGTATPVGDPIEFDGMRKAFAHSTDRKQFCYAGSIKANIGHLYESSGVLGLINAVLAMRNRTIPPLANFVSPNLGIDLASGPIRVATEPQKWDSGGEPRRSGVSAFGLGGTNCHVVLEEYLAPEPRSEKGSGNYPFTISAQTETSLKRLANRFVEYIDSGALAGADIDDVCYTSNLTRTSHRHRLALGVSSIADLREKLAGISTPWFPVYSTVADWTSGVAFEPDGSWHESAKSFVDGGPVTAEELYDRRRPRVVSLPLYEFEDEPFFVAFPDSWRERLTTPIETPGSLTHRIEFVEVPAARIPDKPVKALALIDTATVAEDVLSASLPEADMLRLESDFVTTEDDLERIADLVADEGYTHLVFALAFEDKPAADVGELDRRMHKNLFGLFFLAKGLAAAGAYVSLVVLTRTALAAVRGDHVVGENSTLAGLAKGIARENTSVPSVLVDIDPSTPPDAVRAALLSDEGGTVVLRGDRRYRELFSELPSDELGGGANYLKPGGTYLITGGTGALGLATAHAFAEQQRGINLVLLSRSGPAAAIGDIAEKVAGLGSNLCVEQADAGDPDSLTRAVKDIQHRFGRIDGIVHAAGIGGGGIIAFRDLSEVEKVVRPKVFGAFVLDQLTRHDRPDFIVHYSSSSAVFPAPGAADYAAANYFLDNMARADADPECHVIAMDWHAWRDIGMGVTYGINHDSVLRALLTEQALEVLDRALRSRQSRVFVGQVHYDGGMAPLLESFGTPLDPAIRERIQRAAEEHHRQNAIGVDHVRQTIKSTEVRLTGRLNGEYSSDEELVARCWANAFGYDEIDVDADFFDLGGDSIMGISLVNDINSVLEVQIEAFDLITERTISRLARHIERLRAAPLE